MLENGSASCNAMTAQVQTSLLHNLRSMPCQHALTFLYMYTLRICCAHLRSSYKPQTLCNTLVITVCPYSAPSDHAPSLQCPSVIQSISFHKLEFSHFSPERTAALPCLT